MGYLHIDNLYNRPQLLADASFADGCYALEKVHGTSAHLTWSPTALSADRLRFFSGGAKHDHFVAIFDPPSLERAFADVLPPTIFYGEAHGGALQGMRATYGDHLRFVVFDVKQGGRWLDVPQVEIVTRLFGLDFVAHERGPMTLAFLDGERDRPSRQAVKNGILEPRPAEGIVVRPVHEAVDTRGNRVIVKHKRAEFRETKSVRAIDGARVAAMRDAVEVADEWVTVYRLLHVLDRLSAARGGGHTFTLPDTSDVVRGVRADVQREAGPEIAWSADVTRAVGARAATLFKAWLARSTVVGTTWAPSGGRDGRRDERARQGG